ncbi:MAG: hypothetical protein VW683_00310 [Betaproteobacteria bacterium]|jgi:hypothetical protein
MSNDAEVFKGKSLGSLMSDIYRETEFKRERISHYISKLADMIHTVDDAAVIAPIIKDFLDVAVKNDDSLVRIATITQRLVSSSSKVKDDGGLLTEEEKQQLLNTIGSDIETLQTVTVTTTEELDQKIEEVEDELAFMRGS